MKSTKCSAYLLRSVIGLWCGVVGWAGVSGLVRFGLYKISDHGWLKVPYDTGFLIALIVGGLVGGFPLAMLGVDWASKKWSVEGDSPTKEGPSGKTESHASV